MGIYNTNNSWVTVDQNASKSGFNQFDQVEYKPDPSGTGVLSSLGVTSATEWTLAELNAFVIANSEAISTITGNIVTDFIVEIQQVGTLTEEIIFEIRELCNDNNIWLKWLNRDGAWEFERFGVRLDYDVDVFDKQDLAKTIFETLNSNQREFSINGKDRTTIQLFKNNIKKKNYFNSIERNNVVRYRDFKAQSEKNDIWVFAKKFVGDITITDYSGTIPNACLVTCDENHYQKTGDIVFLKNTQYDDDTEHEIVVISDTEYYINLTYSAGDNTGNFQRKVVSTDWLRCQVDNVDILDSTMLSTLNINLTILLPSNG